MKYYYCKVICIFDIFIGNKLYICGGVCFVMGYMFYFMEVYDVVVGKFDRIVLDCFFFEFNCCFVLCGELNYGNDLLIEFILI